MMEQILFIQTGFGVDVHGQNITNAAERAVRNAIFTNSMPGIQGLLPDGDLQNMVVNINWRYRVTQINSMRIRFARLSLMAP